MQCPKCLTEMRILDNKLVRKDGEIVRRMRFVCRSRDCENNDETTPQVQYFKVAIEDD